MTLSIFAPEPVFPRGDVTPAHWYTRFVRNLDPFYTEQIGFKLKDLANEFDISNVGWEELGPFYREVHKYQENRRSEFEIALLGIGYATVLRALRISENRFGEREPDDVQEILTKYLETFLLLRNKHLHSGMFTNSLSRLIQEGASYLELYACFWFAEDIATRNIELDDIEAAYFGAMASTECKQGRANLLIQAMHQIIQQNRERNEFLNRGPKIGFGSDGGEVRTKNYLPVIVNAAITLTKLVFGFR